ncbi:MAG: alpha/beta hydrolase [Rhodospirillaceae bacterium]|nr:alpha/beta hydrolase [Rhodospirillaceae bacterium]|tara:strand:+ start:25153 stop:25980 length:828 start_codon:yes stop_codon:yes gene_type:complete
MLQSRKAQAAGHEVHYWEGGEGFPVLILHGVGPGTSIMGNFGPVLEPLAEHCHIFAADLIGFGDSGRKKAPPYFDVELWVDQAVALIDEILPTGPCGIAGHSMGGALSLKTASRCDRIQRILTSSTVGSQYPLNAALDGFWTLPDSKDSLRSGMEKMVGNPAALTEDMIDQRWELLQSEGYADYFGTMFDPPRQKYLDQGVLSEEELSAINAQIVMLHGRDDQPCPAGETTMALAPSLPNADVYLLGSCGHNLPRERSADYLAAAIALFGKKPQT